MLISLQFVLVSSLIHKNRFAAVASLRSQHAAACKASKCAAVKVGRIGERRAGGWESAAGQGRAEARMPDGDIVSAGPPLRAGLLLRARPSAPAACRVASP